MKEQHPLETWHIMIGIRVKRRDPQRKIFFQTSFLVYDGG